MVPLSAIISNLSNVLPVIAGLLFLFRLSVDLRVLFVFCLLKTLTDLFGLQLALEGVSNLWLFHISTLMEYLILILVFSFWQKNAHLRKWLRLSIPLFALFWIVAKLTFEDFGGLDNYSAPLANVLLIAVAAYTLYEVNKENVLTFHRMPSFWVACGVLIYYTGNLTVFTLGNIVVARGLIKAWYIHSAMNIIANLCYAGGFVCLLRR